VIDTNIALYLLGGDRNLTAMLNGQNLVISQITRMELLSFPDITKAELARIEVFLETWPVEFIQPQIESLAIGIRRKHRLKLPDSIVAATALHLDLPLMTADKQLERLKPEVQVVRYAFGNG
jgi:predicted nucleic acid-binding protein